MASPKKSPIDVPSPNSLGNNNQTILIICIVIVLLLSGFVYFQNNKITQIVEKMVSHEQVLVNHDKFINEEVKGKIFPSISQISDLVTKKKKKHKKEEEESSEEEKKEESSEEENTKKKKKKKDKN